MPQSFHHTSLADAQSVSKNSRTAASMICMAELARRLVACFGAGPVEPKSMDGLGGLHKRGANGREKALSRHSGSISSAACWRAIKDNGQT